MSEYERVRAIAFEVINEHFSNGAPDWWPDTEGWAAEIAAKVTGVSQPETDTDTH